MNPAPTTCHSASRRISRHGRVHQHPHAQALHHPDLDRDGAELLPHPGGEVGGGGPMKKWHLIIDVARCHDCNDCFLADRDEFVGNDFPPSAVSQPNHGHRWMNIKRKERGQYPIVQVAYLPMPCMHCDEAPCLTADGAVYKLSLIHISE